jgi:hypothetical protein
VPLSHTQPLVITSLFGKNVEVTSKDFCTVLVTCHRKLGGFHGLPSGVVMSPDVRAPHAHLSSVVVTTREENQSSVHTVLAINSHLNADKLEIIDAQAECTSPGSPSDRMVRSLLTEGAPGTVVL